MLEQFDAFARQQNSFPFQPGGKTAKLAAFGQDAMTGDKDGDWIGIGVWNASFDLSTTFDLLRVEAYTD